MDDLLALIQAANLAQVRVIAVHANASYARRRYS
jgi:hypothetical protein